MNCQKRLISGFIFYFCLTLLFFFASLQQSNIAWAANDDGNLVDRNFHYGYSAGFNLDSSSTNNTCVGVEAGFQTGAESNIGVENTFIGDGAGRLNTSGDKNTCVGKSAGSANTTGNMNTFIGRNAAKLCQDGTASNVMVGDSCGEDLGGSNNTFIGEDAGRHHQSGDYNVFIGTNCGYNNGKDDSGTEKPTTKNVFIGADCGNNNTGSGNVFIGYQVGNDCSYNDDNNILMIGNENSDFPLIFGDFASDEVQINAILKTTGLATFYARSTFLAGIQTTYCLLDSDRRWKKEIKPIKNAISLVEKLDGVSYFWKQDEFPEKQFSDRRQIGLIAQDVEKVLPDLVWTDTEGYKSIAYSQIVPVLIEAVKSQQQTIERQQSQIDELKSIVESLVGKRM